MKPDFEIEGPYFGSEKLTVKKFIAVCVVIVLVAFALGVILSYNRIV